MLGLAVVATPTADPTLVEIATRNPASERSGHRIILARRYCCGE
jgi:hypothetical protein